MLAELVASNTRRRNRVDRSREHGGLGFGLWDATALAFAARGVNDRADHREVPGDGEIAPEDALLLPALDQRLQLVEHGDVTPVELLRREPGSVESVIRFPTRPLETAAPRCLLAHNEALGLLGERACAGERAEEV